MRCTLPAVGRRITGGVKLIRGRWHARVVLHREPRDATGRYRQHVAPLPLATSKAHALRLALLLQADYTEGRWSPARAEPTTEQLAAFTVAAWVDRWLSRQDYSEAARDRARVEAWLPRCRFGALALSAVTPRDAAALVAELRALPSPKTGGAPAPRTVRNVVDPIARAIRGAVFEGLITADPFAALPTAARPQSVDARPERRRSMRLGRADLEVLLTEPGIEPRWSILWHVLALTGARLGEAIGLRWRDVQADVPLSRVVLASQIHHRTRAVTPTKTGAVREVPLHPTLAAELARWREGWATEYGRAPLPGDLIVPTHGTTGRPGRPARVAGAGSPLDQQQVHRALQRDLLACGIDAHRVHDLRHTFVSLCADAGMSADVVTRWTHAAGGVSARALYLVPSWDRQCAEMQRLALGPGRRARAQTG